MASSAAARPGARAVDTVITFRDTRATMTSGGVLASTLGCCATRTSVDRAEQFEHHGHSLTIDNGWKEVADAILTWLTPQVCTDRRP